MSARNRAKSFFWWSPGAYDEVGCHAHVAMSMQRAVLCTARERRHMCCTSVRCPMMGRRISRNLRRVSCIWCSSTCASAVDGDPAIRPVQQYRVQANLDKARELGDVNFQHGEHQTLQMRAVSWCLIGRVGGEAKVGRLAEDGLQCGSVCCRAESCSQAFACVFGGASCRPRKQHPPPLRCASVNSICRAEAICFNLTLLFHSNRCGGGTCIKTASVPPPRRR